MLKILSKRLVQGWHQEFSHRGLTLPTRGQKYGFQCTIHAKNLRKNRFSSSDGGYHAPTGQWRTVRVCKVFSEYPGVVKKYFLRNLFLSGPIFNTLLCYVKEIQYLTFITKRNAAREQEYAAYSIVLCYKASRHAISCESLPLKFNQSECRIL